MLYAPSLTHVAAQELCTSHSELKQKENKEHNILFGHGSCCVMAVLRML